MEIIVRLEWLDEPTLDVQRNEERISVTAHPGLSQSQVRAACDQLDSHGDAVYAAWCARINGGGGFQPVGQVKRTV